MSNAYVWIDPARKSGEPCVGGTRVPVEMVADIVWAHGVDEALTQWPYITRPQILNACWYAAVGNVVRLHGKGGKYVARRWAHRTNWARWARDAHQALWEGRFDDVTDPSRADGEHTTEEAAP